MPGYIAAFTAAHDATTFMVERGETGWEFKMISRSTLAGLLNDLRLVGKKGFCMNPTNDGGKKSRVRLTRWICHLTAAERHAKILLAFKASSPAIARRSPPS